MTPQLVIRIRDLYLNHEVSVTKLAEHFGISRPYCVQIVTYKRWKQPQLRVRKTNAFAVPEPILTATKLDRADVKEIRRMYTQKKQNMRQLASTYGVSHSTIVRVINETTWKRTKEDVKRDYNAARMRRNRPRS